MSAAAELHIALLRGVNVGGKNLIPMARLRQICLGLGWREVRTYIQSGNVIFAAADEPARLEPSLESVIDRHLGLSVPVIVRTAPQWLAYADANPFAMASQEEPNRVMLTLSRHAPKPDALDLIRDRAADDERVEISGGALWIHYGSGAGRSKLSPTFLDRVVGSPVTARNWKTVQKLREMLTV